MGVIMIKKTLLFVILAVFCLSSFAQVNHKLKEITVEAESESKAIKKQKEALTANLVLGRKDINNFGHHAAGDVIKRMPRLVVVGPPSFNRNIMMAGLEKEFQSILIDGKRPAGGEDYRDLKLDRIPVDLIESIEIIYNPPASMGGDATIGLVDVKLKEAPDKKIISSDLSFDYNSTNPGFHPTFNITYGDKINKFSFIGSYSFNQFNRVNLNNLRDTAIDGIETEDIFVNINAFNIDFAYAIDSNSLIKYKTFFSRYYEELDFISDIKKTSEGDLNFTADTANDEKIRMLHTHSLSYTKKGKNFKWVNDINIAQHFDSKDRLRHQQKTDGLTITLEDEFQRNTESVLSSNLTINKQAGNTKHKIVSGIRFSGLWRNYDRLVYSKLYDHKYWDDETDGSYELNEYRASTYLSNEITVGKIGLQPAIRFDKDARSYTTQADTGNFNYTTLNPSLHTKYSLNDWFLKADLARQIARPAFNLQVPVDKIKHKKSTIERGNPDLKPSTAWNIGVGVEKYYTNTSYVTLRGFYSIMRNVVETKDVGVDDLYGYRILQSVNVDSGLVWGADINAHIKLLQMSANELSTNANVSWLGSEVRDPGTGELRRLNEQPKWISNATIDYLNTKIGMQFSVGVNYIGKREIAATTTEDTPVNALYYNPFTQWDARIKYFFSQWGSIYLNAINIFDEKVDLNQGTVNESEVIGRNFIVGLSMRF